MKKGVLKTLALTMGFVLAGSSLVPALPVHAANDLPKEINLPITLRDFSADNLLFQYDLGDEVGQHFTLTSQAFSNNVSGASRIEAYTGTYYMEGLVETALDTNTHALVYKQDTVEQVAKMVYLQVMNPSTRITTTDRFNALAAKLAVADPNALNVIGVTDDTSNRLTSNYFFKSGTGDEVGWVVDGTYTTAGSDVQINGTTVWSHMYGIWHLDTGEHKLTKTVTGLDSNATYTLSAELEEHAGTDIEVNITANGQTITSDDGVKVTKTMEITGVESVDIEITAKGTCLVNNLFLTNNDTQEVRNFVVFNTAAPTPLFTNSGWYPVDSTLTESGLTLQDASGNVRWRMDGDGLMNYGDSTSVYTYVTLNPGQAYIAMYDPMSGQDLTVNIYDESDNLIIGNVESGYEFTAPAGTGKIKVVVIGTGDASKTDWTQSKLVNLSFMQIPNNSILGDYNTSKTKFADTAKGWDDISTCMDYAYFVLNNLYTTRTGLNTSYSDYTTVTLKEISGKPGHYGFYANASDQGTKGNVVYDAANQNIKNSTTGSRVGMFPLDNASGYLTSADYNKYADEVEGGMHNFHYSMYSHANFVYEKDADLYFDFVGDDDVYLFIDGALVMDIGGAHLAVHKTMKVNDYADALGLIDGRSYSFDFFYLERCTGFSNLAIETNIQLLDDGSADVNLYNSSGTEISNGSSVTKDSEVQVEYEFRANVNDVKNLDFDDTGLGVKIGISGMDLGTEVELANNELTVTVIKADGTTTTDTFTTASDVQNFFNNLTLERDTVVKISGLVYKMDAALNSQLTVAYTSKDYAGAVHAETAKTADAAAGLTIATGGTTGSPTGGTNSGATDNTSGGDTQGTGDGAGSKVPKTGDAAPIGLCVTILLAGIAFVGIGEYRKRKI